MINLISNELESLWKKAAVDCVRHLPETLFPRIKVENVYFTANTFLPYDTITSHLMSQSSDLHKWKSWGHKPSPVQSNGGSSVG
jgi:hypothetical protein